MAARSIIGCARPGCTGAARCAQGRPPDYLDFGKKLFSLLCFRREPVPSTMAAAVGMPAASSRADAAGLAPPAHLAARALLATDSQNNGFNARRHDNHEQATDRSPAAALARGHRRRAKLRHAVRHRRCGRDLSQQRAGRLRGRVHRPFERRAHDRQPVRQPLGIKGSEDLGGGMRALFVLENGFDITNGTSGQGGRQFGRQAFVGLGSDRYGTVTLGRQYTSLDDFVSWSARRRILAASARTRATSTTSTRPRGSTARSSTRAPTTRASRSARCTASAASRAA